jgi:hypothetical protein
MKNILKLSFLVAIITAKTAFVQSTANVFPQFVDGVQSDGTSAHSEATCPKRPN